MSHSTIRVRPHRRTVGKRRPSVAPALLVTAALAGCDAALPTVYTETDIAEITLSASKWDLSAGDTVQILATLIGSNGLPIASPSAGTLKSNSHGLVWTSSDPEAVAISESGLVTANKAGAATVTASKGSLKGGGRVKVTSPYVYSRASDPARTIVTNSAGDWLATFTDGAHTVTIAGPSRTFSEPAHTIHTVTHTTWVRLLSSPFVGTVDEAWLTSALGDSYPDVLATAMQYIHEAPPVFDASGFQIGGDANYGPLQEDDTRKEGADYSDYLGIPWVCGDGTIRYPRAEFFRSIDCTGFVQMVYGYRGGLPLACRPDGVGIPRTARHTLASAPGLVIIPNAGEQVIDFARLAVGDLVFFDANNDGIDEMHHVGIYLGVDSGGNYRFMSSVKGPNGPTLGDVPSRHLLNDLPKSKGYWAQGFRATRRL
jgi:cell wall-associated NlpC family hydrolase